MIHFPDSRLEGIALSCVRGENLLFDSLDFSVQAGEICQVFGANGAGKTSLLRILCGLALPESGQVLWNGVDIDEQREVFTSSLGYVGHQNGIKGELNPLENLAAIRALTATRDDMDAESALENVGLYGYEDIPCRYLSAGQKRRVALSRLLLTAAQCWILDEPVTALDAQGVADFQKVLENHAKCGGLVLITSHQALTFGSIETRRIEL
ncbi:MAG: cytochrome c biogenesis ATP-binding export protein CcmA [marine bacterium B5-7]|nr:MAG: cytochrome c biogenesis ATP-binding export protein CcmA [marine bacterium B5-7]